MLDYPGAAIRYTTDGSEPDMDSRIFLSAFTPEKGTTVRTQGFTHDGKKVGKEVEKKF